MAGKKGAPPNPVGAPTASALIKIKHLKIYIVERRGGRRNFSERKGSDLQPSGMHYSPLEWPFLLGLFLLLSVVVVLVELRILRYAYERMGTSPRSATWILVLTLVGSSINIPVAEFPPERVISGRVVRHFGMQYVVPVVHQWPATILAINVGGALIPVLLSIYLAFKNQIVVKSAIAVAAVALVTHQLPQPVRCVGVALPIFIPPIIALLCAVILSWRQAEPLAYTWEAWVR